MEKIIAACATDDGVLFINRRFLDARKYDVYEIGRKKIEHLASIPNTVSGETSQLYELMDEHGVNVWAAKQFGRNDGSTHKKIIPVIVLSGSVETGLLLIQEAFDLVTAGDGQSEDRKPLVLKEKTQGSSAPVFVAYSQKGEPPRRAALVRVGVPVAGLSDDQVQLIGHLNKAVDIMNLIFRKQLSGITGDLEDFLRSVQKFLPQALNRKIDDYLIILNLQNGPWSFIPRKNHLLDIEEPLLEKAAGEAGRLAEYDKLRPFLHDLVLFPDKAEYYPEDITESVLEKIGDEAKKVNTLIITDKEKGYRAIRNELFFHDLCGQVVKHLTDARQFSDDPEFTLYIDAKIEELRTGSEEARRLADYHWIKHRSDVDVIISSALEVYLDAWQNMKGAACGAVLLRNRSMDQLLKKFIQNVPEWEKNAPWKWRREEIDKDKLPRLKFVDVFNWSGDYISSPQTVLAQSLPNDEWVAKNIGTVNMLYRNTGEAVHTLTGNILAEEFLPAEISEFYAGSLYFGGQIQAILHEIGHTTGKQDPDHPGQPSDYLKDEYSPLEEARAELFGMWAAQEAVKNGIIPQDTADAAQYSMLLSMIKSLKFEAAQAHTIARNIIYHYLREKTAIRFQQEQGKKKLSLDLTVLHTHVAELLGIIGNIKAAGDREGAAALRQRYCMEDPLRPEIEKRTFEMPMGTGLIFPVLKESEGRFLRDLEYTDFIGQAKFV